MHRYGSLPVPLSRGRVGVRLHPAPAAAPSDQPYLPDSSLLVCRSRTGPLGTESPPSHHDRGDGMPRVLALIGACDARGPLVGVKVFAHLDRRRSKGQNMGVCAQRWSPRHLPQSSGAVSSSPTCDRGETLGANHAVEKKEVLEGRCIVSLEPLSQSTVRYYLRAQPV